MKKFLIRFLFISAGILLIFYIKNYQVIKDLDIKKIPRNNLCNSMSFKAKMDHLVSSPNYDKCDLLISGSSISLNNVSGKMLADSLKYTVYNISSWGFKVDQTNRFLNVFEDKKIKHVLVAFNNTDFREVNYNINYETVRSFIEGGKSYRFWLFLCKFNLETFLTDWNRRSIFSKVNNEYRSINFDETGSCQFSKENFKIDAVRWKRYDDTTGFSKFHKDATMLKTICEKRNIDLTLVYLPNREDLLTEKNKAQNDKVGLMLNDTFGKYFIDLHNVKIPAEEYCDGMHYFREGAERVTSYVLDSLDAQKD